MAIFIENSTRCPLCNISIKTSEKVVGFPPMVWNELDTLSPISDAVVHVNCLQAQGLLERAENRKRSVLSASGPGKRECSICKQQITTPEEHVTLGHLTDDEGSVLYPLNLAQFHRSCLRKWNELPHLIEQLRIFNNSGEWSGPWLDHLVNELAGEAASVKK